MNGLFHVRSAYSLLKSTLSIPAIIKYAKEHQITHIGLCDLNVMHGSMQFFHLCKKVGITPVFGMEVSSKVGEEILQLLLYAKNDKGYQDLMRLSTETSLHHTILTTALLKDYTQDCFVVTSGAMDALDAHLVEEDYEGVRTILQELQRDFQSLYIGITRNDSGLRKVRNVELKRIASTLEISCISYSSAFYETEEDEESYRVLCAIDQGVSLDAPTLNFQSARYIRTKEELLQLYEEEDLLLASNMLEQCCVEMNFPKANLPVFENNLDLSSEEYLKKLCIKGLQKRFQNQQLTSAYKERLLYELDIINSMGYADYFLIVWDFIRFAKSKEIYVGPGRGSAAGSLVSYCLGITHVDPIAYDLLFERFLNPERISMPDIDTDFPDNRRDEVIQYVKEHYGEEHVAHIVTFNTLATKQVLRDVGRVMKIKLHEIDSLCKSVPRLLNVTLDYAYENSAEFKRKILSTPTFTKLFRIAKKLEGLPRHTSIHAAGIVLSREAVVEVAPLLALEDGVNATQYTMEYLEELGLIKMDFLGLRNLTIIDDIVQMIKHSNTKSFDIMQIPLNDKKTFDLIKDVDTMGVFQLESEGMKNLIKKMQPYCFEDIVATIALFRPGPMENIPMYLHAREHPEDVVYLHDDMKPIVSTTFGIMIYQEQIMQVAQVMAGFSLGKADVLRKAISKKHEDEIMALQKEFIEGCLKKGYTEKLAHEVYALIMKFANYGFNRSHSVAYGMVAYQMAYLKANYPLYFFVSLLNSVIGSERKTSEYIFEARKRGIFVAFPNVNIALNVFVIKEGTLYYPILGVKGIGSVAVKSIVKEREVNGEFKDFFDFVARVSLRKIGQGMIESLIDAGALDVFGESRKSMHLTLPHALRYTDIVKVEDEDQVSLDFSLVERPMMIDAKDDATQMSEREYQALGLYLSEHPIARLRSAVNRDLPTLYQLKNKSGHVRLLCQVERTKQHRTKRGDIMMFAVGADETDKIDLVCMPNIYEKHQYDLVRGNYLYVEGKIDKPGSCLVNKIKKVE